MKSQEQTFIEWLYRSRHTPRILAACIAAGVVLMLNMERLLAPDNPTNGLIQGMVIFGLAANSALLVALIGVRIGYRRQPNCPVCGLDAVDCKIQRNSLLPHRKRDG